MLPFLDSFGGEVGLAASGLFMVLIAVVNVVLFRESLEASRRSDSGDAEVGRSPGGPMTRLFGRLLKLVNRPPQMYFVGLLFGLGMDTASEVAFLAIAATAGAGHLPMLSVLVLPLSFASGMAIVDTAEGLFMERAYLWAQDQPTRRIRYNLFITGFTAVAAAAIGAIEVSGMSRFGAPISSSAIGAMIVAVFPLAWMGAALMTRSRGRRQAVGSS
jgi:high-affinity nickel-transport protein